jgi:hypothetical protein
LELVVSLKTAKAIGIKVPDMVRARRRGDRIRVLCAAMP